MFAPYRGPQRQVFVAGVVGRERGIPQPSKSRGFIHRGSEAPIFESLIMHLQFALARKQGKTGRGASSQFLVRSSLVHSRQVSALRFVFFN